MLVKTYWHSFNTISTQIRKFIISSNAVFMQPLSHFRFLEIINTVKFCKKVALNLDACKPPSSKHQYLTARPRLKTFLSIGKYNIFAFSIQIPTKALKILFRLWEEIKILLLLKVKFCSNLKLLTNIRILVSCSK